MSASTFPSSLATTHINDPSQVFTNTLSLSSLQGHLVEHLPKFGRDLRRVPLHLEMDGSSFVEGVCASRRVNPAEKKMKRVVEARSESESNGDAPFTWSAILQLQDVLKKTVQNGSPRPELRSSPYGVWLSNFAKSQFQACISLVQDELIRILPAAMKAPEVERVQSLFNSILQFELSLLDSALADAEKQTDPVLAQQPSASPWHPSNIIFTTDYDVTCTVVDSCEALVRAAEAGVLSSREGIRLGKLLEDYEAGLHRHSERSQEALSGLQLRQQKEEVTPLLSRRRSDSDDLVPGMDPVLKPLFDSSVKSSSPNSKKDFKDVPFDDEGLRKALLKLSDLEVLCNEDVMSIGVLRGSTKEGIVRAAKQVDLRPNCARVLQELAEVGTTINVVSANWSRDLIRGGLPHLPENKLFLHCNDLFFDKSGVSTGAFDMTMVDAFDKEQMLRVLRKMYTQNASLDSDAAVQTSETEDKSGKMLVYMGDSHTDLLGLLEADLGIVIGNSAVVRTVLSLYGIQLLPLEKASAYITLARLNGTQRSWRRSGILFEAQGWADVEACLFGVVSPPTVAEPAKKSDESLSVQQQKNISQEHPSSINLEFVQFAC